jgi:hypothetical protein
MLSGLINLISFYLGKILVDDIFISFDYVFDFRFAFLVAVMRLVRTCVLPGVLFFTAAEQESRFGLKRGRKILIFDYPKIWSVRILLNPIIIIIRCGPTFIVLIFFILLYILIVVWFTDRFLFNIIDKSSININLGSDIALTFYLLDGFIFNNISIGFGNVKI